MKNFSESIDEVKSAWEKIKTGGKKLTKSINLTDIKEKGKKLIEETKKIYKEIVIEGKDVTEKFEVIYGDFKKFGTILIDSGSDGLRRAEQMIKEAVYAVKQNLSESKVVDN